MPQRVTFIPGNGTGLESTSVIHFTHEHAAGA